MGTPNTETSSVLKVARVSKSYGRVRALDEFSMDVGRGEFVALLGPNGAGKTTLFQLLSGLFVADQGRIEVNGFDISRNAIGALANLGVVFQQPTLDLDLTVQANLQFHARLHGLGRSANQRIADELERQALLDERHTQCRKLSGGNRRRVELARALLAQPSCLLMDEATVGLDPAARRSIVDYVHGLCEHQGTAVLWSTHLVDEAERADRIVLLHRGQLVVSGTPAEVTAHAEADTLSDAFIKLTGRRSKTEADAPQQT